MMGAGENRTTSEVAMTKKQVKRLLKELLDLKNEANQCRKSADPESSDYFEGRAEAFTASIDLIERESKETDHA
jgi:hypothetical protein